MATRRSNIRKRQRQKERYRNDVPKFPIDEFFSKGILASVVKVAGTAEIATTSKYKGAIAEVIGEKS